MRATIATWSGKKLEPAIYPYIADTLAVMIEPAAADTVEYARGTVMGRVTDTGTYKAYSTAAADGSEVAAGLLLYDISVDTAGKIAQTTTPGASGEVGERGATTAIYIRGYFFGSDLLQEGDEGVLDAGAVDDLRGRWLNGGLTDPGSIFKF